MATEKATILRPKLALIASWLGLLVCAMGQGNPPLPIHTNLCELVATPAKFNGKRVDVRGKVLRGFERTVLLDETCRAEVLVERDGFPYAGVGGGEYAFWGRLESIRKALGLPEELHWNALPPHIDFVEDDAYRTYTEALRNARLNGRQESSEITVAVIGRFDYIPEGVEVIATRGSSSEPISYHKAGFGHMGGSRLRLVEERIQAVEIHPVATAPIIKDR